VNSNKKKLHNGIKYAQSEAAKIPLPAYEKSSRGRKSFLKVDGALR
jgi:hypothetical protein